MKSYMIITEDEFYNARNMLDELWTPLEKAKDKYLETVFKKIQKSLNTATNLIDTREAVKLEREATGKEILSLLQETASAEAAEKDKIHARIKKLQVRLTELEIQHKQLSNVN